MVIGIDASRASISAKTGVEWYAYHLLAALEGVIPPENSVILYKQRADEPVRNLPPNWKHRVIRWPFPAGWTAGGLSWEMFRRPPDALFVPAYTLPLRHPKTSVVTIHDCVFHYAPSLYAPRDRWMQHRALRHAVKNARMLIVPSRYTKETILEKHPARKPESITVVPLGYDVARFTPAVPQEAVLRTLAKYRIEKKYLLFVGRLERKKNVLTLIEAFERIAPKHEKTSLVFVGKKGFGYSEIQAGIARSAHAARIHELGWVAEKELPHLYAGAAVTVVPSWYEGFGMPVLESMACGTPVIASSTGALPEVAGNAALLCDPADAADFVASLTAVLSDRTVQERLREKGFERVKKYTWKACAEHTWHALQQACT